MRFMLMVKANADTEAGKMPSRAGVLLAGEGLQASSKGARVTFRPGGKPIVVDGPFAESKELMAGFWLIQVNRRKKPWYGRSAARRRTDLREGGRLKCGRFSSPPISGRKWRKASWRKGRK